MFQFDNSAYQFYVHSVCRVGDGNFKKGKFCGEGVFTSPQIMS